MNQYNTTQPATAGHNPAKRQVDDKSLKSQKRLRLRSGLNTVAYWAGRLFKNSYGSRGGVIIEIPEWYVRMRYHGESRRVRLSHADKDKAAEEARCLALKIAEEGWRVLENTMARLPPSPTIDQFCKIYEEGSLSMEEQPRAVSRNLYVRQLRRICDLAGVTHLRQLDDAAIQRARTALLVHARKQGRTPSPNTFAIMVRNAAACFSVEMLEIYQRQGLKLSNPFSKTRCSVKIEPVSPLDVSVVNRIWVELPALRDGDPTASVPDRKKFNELYAKVHKDRRPRWSPADFTKSHPAAYAAIVLGLGLGLRANEIDKARWGWFQTNGQGELLFETRKEIDFTPKGGSKRFIKVPKEVHDALLRAREDLNSPYVIGGEFSQAVVDRGGWGYRRPDVLRTARLWLSKRGIEEGVFKPKRLQRLRKQFGSEVASVSGLFAAQKLLGHASPVTTSQYYAAHTNLPVLAHVKIVA